MNRLSWLLIVIVVLTASVIAACAPIVFEQPEPVTEQSGQIVPAPQEPAGPLPIIDTHVHYSNNSREIYSENQVLELLRDSHIPHALVSSSPDDNTLALYEEDPTRVIPFLRPYHNEVTSSDWLYYPWIIDYLRQRLSRPIYAGIGEFHLLTAGSGGHPIMLETGRLAAEQDMYLHIHSGAAEVRTVFTNQPNAKVLWAHAGLSEPPTVVLEMLNTYENLWIDTSLREGEILKADGSLDHTWETIFLTHPDRVTVGSDTWIPARWKMYEDIMVTNRAWLSQLPPEIAEQIAWKNAATLFGIDSMLHDAE